MRSPGAALGAALVLVALSAACAESGAKPTTTIQAADTADQVLVGFAHYVTDHGVRRSRVEADTAFFYEATQTTELRNVRVVFYDQTGAETSNLTAREGTYRWQDGAMDARGAVVVTAVDGRRLRTEKLVYDATGNQITTDQPFTFDRGADHLEGTSFRSDPGFRNIVMDRPRGVAGEGMVLPGQ